MIDGLISTSYSITVNIWNCAVDGGAIESWDVSSLDIQNCRVVDGLILTLSSHTVNIWNCTVDGGAIDSRSVSSLDIQNCRVVDGLILTLSSHTVNIWNCVVDGGVINSWDDSSLNIQNCVLHGPANFTTGFFDSDRASYLALTLITGVVVVRTQRVMIQNTNVSEYTEYGIGIASVDNGTIINGCSTKTTY